MIRCAILTAALALSAGIAEAEDRALVIGINDYSAVAGAPALTGAVRDADRIAAALTETMAFDAHQITLLQDSAARHDVILSTIIDRLIGETRSGDRVVLYFAGLGTILDDGTPGLVAFDGDTVLGRIPLETLSSILTHISDRDVTVILDTGFQAGLPGSRGLGAAAPTAPLTLGDGIALWTPSDFAWEDAEGGALTQLWTAALTDEAADANGDLAVTQTEVQAYLAPALDSWCSANSGCAEAGRGLMSMLTGGAPDTVLARLAAPEVEVAPVLTPIEEDDGLPASYRETLGFVTDLFSPSNDAGLTLAINGGEVLRVGEIVSFTAAADRDGALLLLDLDPSGALVQVYPSQLSIDGATRVAAGQTLTIPNALGTNGRPLRIRVTEPAGQGLLLAVFIEGDLAELSGLMPAGLEGGPIANGNQSLFRISQNLLRMEADPDRPISWSATYLPYRIEP